MYEFHKYKLSRRWIDVIDDKAVLGNKFVNIVIEINTE